MQLNIRRAPDQDPAKTGTTAWPHKPDSSTLLEIRLASRTLVRELGFLNKHLAGTTLTPSQVHALLELERFPDTQASDLCNLFRLDKSAVSRLLADLVQRDFIRASRSATDKRERRLRLTNKGRAALEAIHGKANRQIGAALQALDKTHWTPVVKSLQLFAAALATTRPSGNTQLSGKRPRKQK